MKSKKVNILILVLVMSMLLSLTACGGKETPDTPATDNTPNQTQNEAGNDAGNDATNEGGEAKEESKETVTLTFMGWEASPLETQAVKDGIAKFEDQYPHIKVDYTPGLSGAEYTAKLLASHAGGSMPDVCFVQSGDYRAFASKGVIEDITDRFDSEYSLDDFLPSVRELMTIDGKVYGIQSCIVTPVLYYNKDLFDAAGVEYPGTEPMQWEEFREKAIALTNEEEGIFGAYGAESTNMVLGALLASNGATYFNEDYTKSTINTPEAKEVFLKVRSLRYDDKAAVDATTLENIGISANQMLQTGKVAMVLDGSWALQELASMNFNIGLAPIPYFKESANLAQAHLHSISTSSKYKDEAWEFLKFLSGMDYQGELVAQGLWMPNRKSMYEEDVVKQWYSEKIHGEYINFLDYFINAKVDPVAMQPSNKCSDILTEETDIFFKDGGDVDAMLQNIEKRVNEVIEEELNK